MCGITGFVGNGSKAILGNMLGAIVHRGPDDEGIFVDPDTAVYLGHRRLAILDLTTGSQPMWSENGAVGVVFNGEIYNHRNLRASLEATGHRFHSDHADTEVLVHGYEEWGMGMFERLNGMFAFVLYDRKKQRLLLARDRFGEKPLFYAQRDGAFVFASELGALLQHPAVANPAPDLKALRKFFAYGFFPSPFTPYVGVSKLAPGSTLEVDLGTGKVMMPRKYWQFRIEPNAPPPGGIEAWTDELECLLDRAVAGRLESDVPLGIFLSGGIDSSTILSSSAKIVPATSIQTFSIGFSEASFDESGPAMAMAAYIGSSHRMEICDLESARDILPALMARLDEPSGDPSILPTYLLSAFASRYVKVALSGDGGDELFAGYDPFTVLQKAALYRKIVPRPVHRAIELLAGRLPISDRNMSFDFKVRRGLRGLGLPPRFWNPVWLGPASPRDLVELFGEKMDLDDLYSEAIELWEGASATGLVDRTMEFFTNLYLSEGILLKSDRASMLNSLEVRAPMLDYDLVDFVRRLPAEVKLRGGETKWILKRAFRRRLPPAILKRRKKGFGIPLARWLREFHLPQGLTSLQGVNETRLRNAWSEHSSLQRDHRGMLWCWLALSYGTRSKNAMEFP